VCGGDGRQDELCGSVPGEGEIEGGKEGERERGMEGEIESVREGEINGKKVTLISGCNITPYFTSKHSFSFSSLLLGFVEELR
jgi:hypothetical protein